MISNRDPLGGVPPVFEWRSITLRLDGSSLEDVSLVAPSGRWLCLVGPTGAGKSLLLEVAAGFHEAGFGRVFRNGIDVTDLPPEEREIAFVPSDGLLFSHLDVRQNLLFGTREEPTSLDRSHQFARIVTRLGITHLLERRTDSLTPGESRRVAIGRAILSGHQLLFLDEFAPQMDADSHEVISAFLSAEKEAQKLSVVYTTSDLSEAHRFADTVVSIENGRIRGVVGGNVANVSRIVPFPLHRR